MKILVTGATGFVGQNLLTALAGSEHKAAALSRNPREAAETLPRAIPCYRWDPETGEMDSAALDRVEAVVHLAGENIAAGRWTEARKKRIRASRVSGTARLVEALQSLPAPPGVFVSASAVGFYGDRGDETLTEASEPGSGFLAQTCRDWEAASLRAARTGMRVVVLRIGVVLGRGGGAFSKMLPPFRLGLGGRLGGGRQWMSWIHMEDLARLLRFAVETPSLTGVLNATAPGPVTNSAFTRALAGQLRRPAFFHVPGPVLRILLGEMACLLLGSARVVPERARRAGFEFRYPRLEDALGHILD